ncbi:hypothetical protein Syun_012961 [Stephania yunnanensis]|uniref:Uncharacterized protein n=1 Tax=Stephania yunnanensis TaxID=152371 RepID=A0AAP0PJY4_9MAGN
MCWTQNSSGSTFGQGIDVIGVLNFFLIYPLGLSPLLVTIVCIIFELKNIDLRHLEELSNNNGSYTNFINSIYAFSVKAESKRSSSPPATNNDLYHEFVLKLNQVDN